MGITGSAISVSQEIYIAFKHLLSLRQNLLHHDQSADHLLRNTKSQQSDMEAAHKDAFTDVCAIVNNKFIKEGGIIKLSDLREIHTRQKKKRTT